MTPRYRLGNHMANLSIGWVEEKNKINNFKRSEYGDRDFII